MRDEKQRGLILGANLAAENREGRMRSRTLVGRPEGHWGARERLGCTSELQIVISESNWSRTV